MIRASLGILIGLAIGLAVGASANSVSISLPVEPFSLVTRTKDGDTFEIAPLTAAQELAWAMPGPEAVRMLCVAAPEKSDPGGKEATAWLAAQLHAGDAVELEAGAEPRDNFGRMLAYVKLNGRDLNLEAVRAGVAKMDRRCARAVEFLAAESEARATRRGVWK